MVQMCQFTTSCMKRVGGGKKQKHRNKNKSKTKNYRRKIGFFVEKVSPRAQKVLAESSILLWSATF